MPLSPGTRLANYEVLAPLGAGGMGEVYRAKDLRLGREVALKVLPAEVASHTDRLARFEREARAVAALNHPNIVVLYSVEDADAVRFLTMELVEGETLDRQLSRGPMPLARVLDVGIALSDALTAAHAKGVVHRDLKPSNVMVTADGRIKVLDFGLAKLSTADADVMQAATMTVPVSGEGQIVGTIAYMAPEQIRGSAVDSRSDLFALGIVLYELASGRRPFAGASQADVASAILRDEPPVLGTLRADVPRDLQRVVARCLEKDPARRVQTATDVHNELELVRRALGSGATSSERLTVPGFGGRPAIAVLPFENRSGDPEQDYFADGLAEDLITRLSLWRAFPVIARNSSFTYKGARVDVREVSAALGVRYVVQGSVRKAGSRVRIAVQLIDAVSARNVWAQTYDRELTDVFAVQDEISEAIATPLVVGLQQAEHAHVQHRAPESLEAWGLYQRALASFYRFTRENFEETRTLLERAVELEPRFSTAWARLAEVAIWQILHGWTESPDRTIALALKHARHAVDLDPQDAEAHAELSFALMTAGDGYAAIEEARRGLELNPSHPMAQLFYAYMWHMTGHPPAESIELVHRAMRLSPRDPVEWLFYDVLASAYFNASRFEEGMAAARRLIGLWPEYYFGQLWCAMNAVGLGQLDAAQAAVRDARRLVPDLSLTMVRRVLGAMAPHVDERMMGALRTAGLE